MTHQGIADGPWEKLCEKKLFPPGLEPGTFRVLGERDNHYTTETCFTVSIHAYKNHNR